ncbi:MAG: Flp pilus assembly protein CpaB [Phenylobacterium sp.]|uniref:Flp pilus assembly protein CpaB n=1 Tax=Phenylobacterium sp. TaxID=1871053 RepID=UPI00391C3A63
MPARNILTLAAAAVLALLAVIAAQAWLTSAAKSRERSEVVVGTVPVVVAARPVERGATLTAADLKIVAFPEQATPEGALNSIAQATGGQRMALRALAVNEPVLTSRISAPGEKVSLSAALTPGMRAVTFRSNDVAGVAGFVLPGDRVDVMLTREPSDAGAAGAVTTVVAENLKVLGVDQMADEAATKPVVAKAITLEVAPEQAQAISLAQAVGSVSLALRHVGDEAALAKRTTTVADLGSGRSPAAGGARQHHSARPSGPSVAVTRGVATTEYRVQQ